jgi:uncharacterized protein YycO
MSEQVSKHSLTGKPPVVPQGSLLTLHPRGIGPSVAEWDRPAQPGDFILTHQRGWTNTLIRFGQGLRYRGKERTYARYNHAALIVSDACDLVEAVGAGVVRSHISGYRKEDYTLVRVWAYEQDRQQAVDYANYCVGAPYGWFTILSLAWTLLTGGRFSFGVLGSHICSGLVAGALERTGAIWDRPNDSIMPADLARYYDVKEGV